MHSGSDICQNPFSVPKLEMFTHASYPIGTLSWPQSPEYFPQKQDSCIVCMRSSAMDLACARHFRVQITSDLTCAKNRHVQNTNPTYHVCTQLVPLFTRHSMGRLMGDASAIPPSITTKGLIPVNLASFLAPITRLPKCQPHSYHW